MTKYIFWGLVLISLNFNIPIGYGTLGLLPGFVGYYLLWKAMEQYGRNGKKAAFVAKKLMLFAAAVYVLDFLSVTSRFLIAGTLISIMSDIGVCCMQYLTILAVEETGESGENSNMQAYLDKLKNVWFFAVCSTFLKYMLLWIPFINIIGIWTSTVAELFFVLAAYRLWKRAGRENDIEQMG